MRTVFHSTTLAVATAELSLMSSLPVLALPVQARLDPQADLQALQRCALPRPVLARDEVEVRPARHDWSDIGTPCSV